MSATSESGVRSNTGQKLRALGRPTRISPVPPQTTQAGLELSQFTPPSSPGDLTSQRIARSVSITSSDSFNDIDVEKGEKKKFGEISGDESGTAGPSGLVAPLGVPSRRKFSFRNMLKGVMGKKSQGNGKSNDADDNVESVAPTPPLPATASEELTTPPGQVGTSEAETQTEEQMPVLNGTHRESPGDGDNNGFVVAAGTHQLPEANGSVKYLEYFLAYLYYIGMSPIKPASSRPLPNWIHWIQASFFWLFSLAAVLQALDETKSGWFQFLLSEDMFNFICFGFYFANCLTRVYYIWLLTKSSGKTIKLLFNIRLCRIAGVPEAPRIWVKLIALGTGTFSLLLSAVYTIFGSFTVEGWSFEAATIEASKQFGQSIFIWTSTDWQNQTDKLEQLYGTELNATTKLFAVFGNLLNFCGTLHACVLLDLWLMVALQIYMLACQLAHAMTSAAPHDASGKCPLSLYWKEYLRLRILCDDSDALFGKLLALVHIQNLLQFCYLLLELLNKTPYVIYPMVDMVSVVKISIAYGLAKKAGEKNDMCKDCVMQCSQCQLTIEIDGNEKSVSVLLAQMDSRPLGVGRGEFFVNQAFVIKFVCAVGSLFLLLAGETKEKCS